jgi:N-acetylated-alpha-linked acidic dipeptidase
MHLEQDIAHRTIWDVIGTIPGSEKSPGSKSSDDWVVAGNHRDAWVYGAVDPNSGTAAMLEAVHGLGELLDRGWRPRRTIVIASWDAEEEGLMGSTEWTEQHADQLAHAVAYFNTDIAVSGHEFRAAATPSLKQFLREITHQVPSAQGDSVYDQWKTSEQTDAERRMNGGFGNARNRQPPEKEDDVRVSDLGSGSDYTPFFQHVGVPSTDISSEGSYGVYHSVFDNYNWFMKFADPTFVYEQQQARVFGLEILHMADTDVLPYDYEEYGKVVVGYLDSAHRRASQAKMTLDFSAAQTAASRFAAAGTAVHAVQLNPPDDLAALNHALRQAESDLLNPDGLPHRTWYKHTIYAPGEFTGYAAVVIPGVNEAISADDAPRAQAQLAALADALNRAAATLEAVK